MAMLTLFDGQLAYGDLPLLDRAALAIEPGERIGLIGRNGSGKSSLLRAIAGEIRLDDGEVRLTEGARVVLVEQEPRLPPAATLRLALVRRGHIEQIHDDRERWRVEARLDEYLQRFELETQRAPDTCSGGERKRAALALALALQPDLLLLDEPTNHLDIDAIARLEALLAKGATQVVITHDRTFLDRVVTRIVELDRGVLRSYPGNFSAYQSRKRDELAAEEAADRRFDRFWAQEEVWIRKGIEARRTRNAGRVARLEALRRQRAERRDRLGSIRLTLDAGERSGRLVAELQGVSKSFGERTVVRALDLRLMRGDRLGLIGPNGAGKSTLIRLLLGELAPDAGTVRLGTNVQAAYFDQLREQLDPDRTVADTISPGSDWIEVGGVRKHVMSYLAEFLFPPRRAQAPVKTLSGGERNRLLLARLFARPANLLVLDEPTNDLDIESLELLEDTLQDYPGTLVLVSHDRTFLDDVVTQTLVAEGDGRWKEYVGGYSDWVALRPAQRPAPPPAAPPEPKAAPGGPARRAERAKLSFRERRELDELPARIESLEREQQELTARVAGADYHRAGAERIKADRARAAAIENELEAAFARWTALEDKARACG
jgi:ATP-binding cassette subfamily F protein uup